MRSASISPGHLRCTMTFGLACVALSPAAAQEYCVACAKPDAVYRCVIERAKPTTGTPLKTLCIGALARQGGHSSCAVRRGTVFDCDGPIRRIDAEAASAALQGAAPTPPVSNRPLPSAPPPAAAGRDEEQPSPESPSAPAPAKKATDGSPRTVEEAARKMTKSSGDAIGKAGDAIADTTRKAWGCVASLFKAC